MAPNDLICVVRARSSVPPLVRVRATMAAATVAAMLTTVAAAQKPEYGDEVYKPSVGQPGKDVVWVPTPDALVTRMLTAAKVTRDDYVFDLGSGDGRIPIAAAKQFGARAVGIEYNADMAELARRNAKMQSADNLVTIITGDIFVEDFSKATVVTMYLLPDLNLKLRPKLLEMKPATRIASHQFQLGDWEPDERFTVETRDAYLWYVPARVAGEWTLREEGGALEARFSLAQRYQKIGGTLTLAGKTQPLLAASLKGDKLEFSFLDPENNLGTARLTVSNGTMEGELGWFGRTSKVAAHKR